jgi:hypothetical protein
MTSATPTIVPIGAPLPDDVWLLTSTGSSSRPGASERAVPGAEVVVLLVSVDTVADGAALPGAPAGAGVPLAFGGADPVGAAFAAGAETRIVGGGLDPAGGGGGGDWVVGVDVANTGPRAGGSFCVVTLVYFQPSTLPGAGL